MKSLKFLASGLGLLLGGTCALFGLGALIWGQSFLAQPETTPPPRETRLVITWATPAVDSPVMEAPLLLGDAPPDETPRALLPTVTPGAIPAPAESEAASEPADAFGKLATRLVIPALGLDTSIVLAPLQGDSWAVDHLGQAVGHLENTASPGAAGNIVLAGHYTLEESKGGPGPFYKLKKLAPGDIVIVYRGEEKFEYVVDGLHTVDDKAIEVTYSTGASQLTLLTCSQWDRSKGEYLKRLIVTGRLL